MKNTGKGETVATAADGRGQLSLSSFLPFSAPQAKDEQFTMCVGDAQPTKISLGERTRISSENDDVR